MYVWIIWRLLRGFVRLLRFVIGLALWLIILAFSARILTEAGRTNEISVGYRVIYLLALCIVVFGMLISELLVRMRVRRHLIEVNDAINMENYMEATKIIKKKLLSFRNRVEFPAKFDCIYAEALHKSGQFEKAEEVINAYLAKPIFNKSKREVAVQLQMVIKKSIESRITFDLDNGVTLTLMRIPAGIFMMGSPASEKKRSGDHEVQHQVKISKSFYMGVHAVTQAQYQAVMGHNPSYFEGGPFPVEAVMGYNPSYVFKGALFPVEQVSWDEAQEFCRRLSEKVGRKMRLPTEAEWEYSCRAGTATPFNTGETIDTEQANYNGNHIYANGHEGMYREKTTPVGSLDPNAWGLYDMHGNVGEWCSDWYGDYDVNDNIDPQGASSGTSRIVRGGSWLSTPKTCRSAYRFRLDPGHHSNDLGFRVALD